jgi:site-specific recombinase XerC
MGAVVGRADRLEDIMSEPGLVDITGRRRSPAATPGHWAGCSPPNKGLCYPADPPTVEEIILVMREAGPGPYADRIRGLIAILWRAGLRISEALALTESDLDPKTGSVLVRAGKGGKRRIVGMDDWAWEHARSLDRAPNPAAHRSAVLHPRWTHPRAGLVSHCRPR